MTGWVFAGVAVVVAILVIRVLRQQGRARVRARAGYLDAVAPLFTAQLRALSPTGFARLSGQHAHALYDLQVVPDTLSYRKLPTLWLLVSQPEPLPLSATLDIMLRPMGGETFSHFNDLPVQIVIPPGFPPDCAIRCDDPAGLPDFGPVLNLLAALDLNGLKEILISPKGLRIVWLAEEANRGRYLLFRDAEMGMTPLSPARLLPILNALAGLRQDLLRKAAA
jgi:hypothetical protein